MGLAKRVKELELEITDLKQTIIFLKEQSEKTRQTLCEIKEELLSTKDYQKEIIAQNKKSEEDRTILLREYLHGSETEE